MISLVVPVYKNAENIPALLAALQDLQRTLSQPLEAVFVVDGSPDDSHLALATRLPTSGLRAQLVALSRNFGSFSAIRAGLAVARGDYFAVMAADLQEPPELVCEFERFLINGDVDVTIGQRMARNDPAMSTLSSNLFWALYRRFVQPELPPGGVDIFGCTKQVRDQLLALPENNSSLVGLLFWVGYRRALVPYERRARELGQSGWTLSKKLRYLTDSVYSFSDLPIRLLMRVGVFGLLLSFLMSLVVAVARLSGAIPVPGYAAIVLTMVFFGALNCFGLGVIGSYVWRTFENTKLRPNYIIRSHVAFPATEKETQNE